MKKLLFGAFMLWLVTACNNENITNQNETQSEAETTSLTSKRICPSEEMRQEALQKNPALRQKVEEIEANAKRFSNNLASGKVLTDGIIEIPVVVNVVYKTADENVSDARIAEQIAVLNADFGGTNSDILQIPEEFRGVKACDVKVRFKLSNTIRKTTTKISWNKADRDNNTMKKDSTGGINATDPTKYLNIWVVGSMPDPKGNILGYATFPEQAGTWEDGVVIAAHCFGKTGASAPFNLGRTATHEVGHYLNLLHLWGPTDAGCQTDYCDDTPVSPGSNGGKPTYPLNRACEGISRSQMFMNYMDYVHDKSMFMFSANQKTRMQAVVAAAGPRAGLR